MSSIPIIQAEHFFPAQNLLGEGTLALLIEDILLTWKVLLGIVGLNFSTGSISTKQRSTRELFVSIHCGLSSSDSLDPETKKHSVDVYPETTHIGTIALREKEGVSQSYWACFAVADPEASSFFQAFLSRDPNPYHTYRSRSRQTDQL